MGWWNRRRTRQEASERAQNEEREASLVASMATAFATALGSVLSAQSEGIKQQGAFLNTLQDLSARKAAQVLGSRGGSTTARRKAAARKASPPREYCALCENPNRRGVTLEMLAHHRLHDPGIPPGQMALSDQSGSNGSEPGGQ